MATASFTSLYDANEDVDLGNGFSVTLRKYLSEDDFQAASGALVKNRRFREAGAETEITGDFDALAYNRVLVERALVSWNLTTDNPKPDGEPIPIPLSDYRSGRYNLPQPVFRLVLKRVLELNEEAEPNPKTKKDKVAAARADADFRK
jgi:hypothetical protein